jgi:hypothetical protein
MAQGADLPVGVAERESGYYYTVQKGDTLWDLSRRFANSPFYWPGMWQKNPQIPNPHRIFPGDRIRLYRKAGSSTQEHPELPSAQTAAFASEHPPVEYRYAGINRVGFIRREPIAPSATIFQMTTPKTISGRFDTLTVRPEPGTVLVAGQRYTVYRPLDPLHDNPGRVLVGFPHLILGIVEITQAGSDLAMAAVLTSFREIQASDRLMPFENRSVRIPLVPSASGIQGKILCDEEQKAMMGDQDLVFIDRGHRDGIRTGQHYLVYDAAEAGTGGSQGGGPAASLPPTPQGGLLVLHTEAETATALVIHSRREIVPGALVASPLAP